MPQHLLLSAKARTLSLGAVLRMTDQKAEAAFRSIRWNDGKPICPECECPTVYDWRKASGAPRWRCKTCRKDFSVTSGTLFASHKMPLRSYLAATAIFVNEVKGKSGGGARNMTLYQLPSTHTSWVNIKGGWYMVQNENSGPST